MQVLILDSATAQAVRKRSPLTGAALEPRPMADGTFALPARVLDDPAHKRHHARLRRLPTRLAAECAWLEVDDDETTAAPPPRSAAKRTTKRRKA